MVAYAIMNGDVHDADAYDKYKAIAGEAVADFGGRFLARGGETKVYEGSPLPRTVIVEFPDMDTAKAFYESDKYAEALKHGLPASTRNYWIVDGS